MTMSLFGLPTLPKDQFEFNQTQFFISFDKKEKITEWNYYGPDGLVEELEKAGHEIIGLSLHEAFKKSASFTGSAHAVYWQLGRLLGYWQQTNVDQCQNDLICRCFGVSRSEILEHVIQNSKTSLNEIGMATKAGLGCGQCHQDIKKTVQDYCDKYSYVVPSKTNPLGLNPISLLIKLDSFLTLWNEKQETRLKIELLGIKDYTVYAKYSESQANLLESFTTTVLNEFGLNLKWEPTNF
ncbi:MAG: hypothetical protein COW01_12155 [Bdellovibrionales bacterium CG12_big_fil_rev_8_21_14_0_65_38_15]|nr:MAG: hypothetical protein COW79_01085 [Bdellovibrionales bacterium CG22_combo_CG10-13_8_21_14_all_38_13]PIQ54084.1 MAG: hypothetical protein COW01_12155 [Bdellovibrionales bacterium CG12_big_fil_rev_8_21_14_0_65_38_15]PIR28609.1 MAG: hypothetical protein COV38_15155 [Bdellovibrionales bacterium CG11_big_fil_rev_8_21_14_0_20_38_13]